MPREHRFQFGTVSAIWAKARTYPRALGRRWKGARVLSALLAGTSMCRPSPTLAQDETASVVVLPIHYEGKAKTAVRDRLQSTLEAQSTQHPQLRLYTQHDRCTKPDCAAELQASGLAFGLRTHVQMQSRDYAVTVELVDPSGDVLAKSRALCEICGAEEVAGTLDDRISDLMREIEARTATAPNLRIRSAPAGAEVIVDGEAVGTTPLETPLAPGPHLVRLKKSGFVTVERELTVVAGVDSQTRFELDPLVRPPRAGPNLIGWGWGTLSTGTLLLTTGIVLLAVDGQQYQKNCSGENVDGDGDCRYLIELKWPGAVFATAGAALTTLGATFLIRGYKQKRLQLKAQLSPRQIGLEGRF